MVPSYRVRAWASANHSSAGVLLPRGASRGSGYGLINSWPTTFVSHHDTPTSSATSSLTALRPSRLQPRTRGACESPREGAAVWGAESAKCAQRRFPGAVGRGLQRVRHALSLLRTQRQLSIEPWPLGGRVIGARSDPGRIQVRRVNTVAGVVSRCSQCSAARGVVAASSARALQPTRSL
jgi:hypothetical protein